MPTARSPIAWLCAAILFLPAARAAAPQGRFDGRVKVWRPAPTDPLYHDARLELGGVDLGLPMAPWRAVGLRGPLLLQGAGSDARVDFDALRGTLTNGTVFDSSVQRNQPATFPLNGVIKCWTEGVQLMKVGGKAKLTCPSDIAYGDRGSPPLIKPGSTLVFEVELLGIEKK